MLVSWALYSSLPGVRTRGGRARRQDSILLAGAPLGGGLLLDLLAGQLDPAQEIIGVERLDLLRAEAEPARQQGRALPVVTLRDPPRCERLPSPGAHRPGSGRRCPRWSAFPRTARRPCARPAPLRPGPAAGPASGRAGSAGGSG
ncbi:hypothetical protein Hsero_0218 [Herbaspirillum seropedicae SmR1]|uniref:Uncharacterized protein n=1 Tax=Herbaspirillum seropedicae (strain SmR1) TaxID=757424 RepID=D8IV25_HERSS|nr:hypothetical protein Hsero_0218 [Herbaspirillum seropedicae SmR1]